jgi:tetratricopeptide (TPR) repeat protein
MATRAEKGLPRNLLIATLAMALLVMVLGGAVLAVKLRPAGAPDTAVERDVALWQKAAAQNPTSLGVKNGLGTALFNAGRKDEAKAVFESVLKLDPKNWVAMTQLGLIVRDSDPARAMELLLKAGQEAPEGSKSASYLALGDLRLARGDAAGAKEAYSRAIRDKNILIDAHVGLARALEALKDLKGALTEYRKAAEFDPTNQSLAAAIARLEQATR